MNRETFFEELTKLNIEITTNQIKQLDTFCDFLIEYNHHTNLTALKDRESIYLKHFYDSLTLTKILAKEQFVTVLDIGSGAGFPGLILKIFFPNINITLLDSNNKKTTFLKQGVEKLHLLDVTIINQRAEEFIQNNRETFNLVTARAVASTDILLELCLPYVKVNGCLILMKGNMDISLSDLEYISTKLGAEISAIEEFKLPIENSQRTLIKLSKKSPTSLEYPRRYDKITKNPLKNYIK